MLILPVLDAERLLTIIEVMIINTNNFSAQMLVTRIIFVGLPPSSSESDTSLFCPWPRGELEVLHDETKVL